MNGIIQLNLAEMANGGFMEQFQDELKKVLKNISDPNTDPTKVRKVTLTASLKADENREVVIFEVCSKSTLVPSKPIATKILIEKVGSDVAAAELKSMIKGQTFFDQEAYKDDKGNIIYPFNKKEEVK